MSLQEGSEDVDGLDGLETSVSRDTWSRRKRQHGSINISLDNDTIGMKYLIKVVSFEEPRGERANCSALHMNLRA